MGQRQAEGKARNDVEISANLGKHGGMRLREKGRAKEKKNEIK